MEQWVCAQGPNGEPGCGFTLIMGVTQMEIPQKCPRCGGRAWDVKGDPMKCRVTGAAHPWRKGIDRKGLPNIDPDQLCEACGAIPVMEGVGN